MQIQQRQGDITSALAATYDPLLARVYANRGIQSPEQLDYKLQHLTSFTNLKDIAPACNILATAIMQEKHIVIVGDYDCDGATSTSLAYLALGAMGAHKVSYMVPNRFAYGYGLSSALVSAMAAEYCDSLPEVIVTVDNGIASHEGVNHANSLGMQVIVTDHHLPGESLPSAACIINPNQPDCPFPHKSTAGVGVIFYVMSALRSHLQSLNWFTNKGMQVPNMAQFLDLVALGTVADLVPLDYNNRILVAQGMTRIRKGHARPGILALIAEAGRNINDLQASDMGFVVGPRLNAAGRLDDMSVGIECLITQDHQRAHTLAQELDQLNRQRRSIEGTMQQQAEAIVDQLLQQQNTALPACVSLYHPDWHEGVVGIVASRIKERWHRPAIIFAQGDGIQGEKGLLKGSARSITGFHIRDALATIAAQHPNLITRFGGHAMAAGLTLPEANLADFKSALLAYTNKHLDPTLLQHSWTSDGCLEPRQIQLHHAHLLRQAGPWGQGFETPRFHGDFTLIQQRLVKEKHLKLVVSDSATGQLFDAIHFNADLTVWPNTQQRARLVYRLDVNVFRGSESVQLLVEAIAVLK